jgi:hypothetical protein
MSILMTPAYLAATAIPLHHARIGWMNLARGEVLDASSTHADSFLYAPVSDQTWEWWQANNVPAWWSVTFTTPHVVNYVGIAAHELGSYGNTVQVQYDAGGGWVDVPDAVLTPADDGAILIIFEDIIADAVRIYITGGTAAPRISVINVGKILEMVRPVKWMGHVPARFNRDYDKRPTVSERGQRLGASLIKYGLQASYSVANISEAWARNVFDLFIVNCMTYGYFISWRPDQFPDEVYYGWTDKPIVPSNSVGGITRLMAVDWNMDIHNPQSATAWGST